MPNTNPLFQNPYVQASGYVALAYSQFVNDGNVSLAIQSLVKALDAAGVKAALQNAATQVAAAAGPHLINPPAV